MQFEREDIVLASGGVKTSNAIDGSKVDVLADLSGLKMPHTRHEDRRKVTTISPNLPCRVKFSNHFCMSLGCFRPRCCNFFYSLLFIYFLIFLLEPFPFRLADTSFMAQ